MKLKFLFAFLLVFSFAADSFAQVAGYTFGSSARVYTPITGGTVIATATNTTTDASSVDDVNYPGIVLPFTFNFNGRLYGTVNINSNGYLTFGSTLPAPGSPYNPLSSTVGFDGAIAGLGRDIQGNYRTTGSVGVGSNVVTVVAGFLGVEVGKIITGTGIPANTTIVSFDAGAQTITMSNNATSSAIGTTIAIASGVLRAETLGSAPNRRYVIQWTNFSKFGTATDNFNFQIILYESTNVIEYVYGSMTSNTTNASPGVGLRGLTNADFQTRTGADWTASAAGGTNAVTMTLLNTSVLPSGTTYTWTPQNFPPNISYTALTNTTSTGSRALNGVSIVDANGVQTGGGLAPRVYWRVNGGAYTSAATSSGSTPFDFTIGTAGLSVNDLIEYFVVAQDLAGLVGATPNTGFAATDVNTIVTPPSNPLSYRIGNSISGTVYVGAGGVPLYTSLSGAGGLFEAINNGVVTGNVVALVGGNTVETGTHALNEFASGFFLFIRPTDPTEKLLEGTTLSAGVAMININGADKVFIDGRDVITNAGRYLRFKNANATPANTGNVIRFQNDARFGGIGYCTVESNSTSAANANILIGTTTGPLGNDSLAIDSCDIKDATGTNAGRFFMGINSTGTGNGAQRNSSIAVLNNDIHGFLANSTGAINFSGTGNGDSLIVDSNYIYNDIAGTAAFTAINMAITTGTAYFGTNNSTANFNSIGGADRTRGGVQWLTSSAFTGISMIGGETITSNIHGNMLSNFGTSGASAVTGILCSGGMVNIGTVVSNTIGEFGKPVNNGATSSMIRLIGTVATYNVVTNTIQYINKTNSSAARTGGIEVAGGAHVQYNIYGNYIANINANSTSTTNTTSPMGIFISATTENNGIVEGNTIFNIKNTNATAVAQHCIGILNTTAETNSRIARNLIYGLTSDGTGTGTANSSQIKGIEVTSTAYNENIINNQITISETGDESRVWGILLSSTGVYNVLYNSVSLSGANSAALTSSYGLQRSSTGITTLRNNIFSNIRTGGLNNYCIGTGSAVNWSATSSDNNLFIPAAANMVGEFAANTNQTFALWKTNSLGDASSLSDISSNLNPANLFLSIAGNLNINFSNVEAWYVYGNGTPVTTPSVSNDYGSTSNVRSTTIAGGPTSIGSDEVTAVTPGPPVITNTIVSNGASDFFMAGKLIATITFNAPTAGFPFNLSLRHFSGINPPGSAAQQYAKCYDSIYISAGTPTGIDYTAQIYVYPFENRNIANVNNMILAKSDDGGVSWNAAPGTGTPPANGYNAGPPAYAFANGLTSFSIFAKTSTDAPLPVELASFTSNVNRNNVTLNWSTTIEENNAGFDIERKPVTSETWSKVSNVIGSGTTNETKNYSFNDRGLNTGKYNYRLKQIDYNGNFHYFNLAGEVIVGVPMEYKLSQNYPNPFNPTTKIDYDLAFDSKVGIRIYDMLGREVAVLVNDQLQAGYYTVQLNGINLASGTYFFRIIAKGINGKEFVMTKKMQLIK